MDTAHPLVSIFGVFGGQQHPQLVEPRLAADFTVPSAMPSAFAVSATEASRR